MSLKYGWTASAVLLACCAAAASAGAPTPASMPVAALAAGPACGPEGCGGGCATGCCPSGNCHSDWCCPKYCFTIEKPPCIHFATVCPKPVCCPCDIEGYGYFPTCWRPWAYPPDYRHCPVPPPGVLAEQPGLLGTDLPAASPYDALPAPRKTANPNPNR